MTPWLNRCHFGDVREVLRRMIADGVKVNTIVTSPPYWGLRDYGHPGQIGLEPTIHEFIATMVEVFDLARQVLADDGTAWVNMGDSYASRPNGPATANATSLHGDRAHKWKEQHAKRSVRLPNGLKHKDLVGQPWRLAFALQDAGWWLRQDIVWNKPNPMPESVRDRCTKAHEYIFLLSKSEKYYFDFEAFQEPVAGGAHARRPSNGVGFGHGYDAGSRERGRVITKPSGWATGATGRAHDELVGRYSDERKADREPGRMNPKARQAEHETGDAYVDGKSERMGRGPGWREHADTPETRNRRSVWTVPTEAFKGAHFATYPTKLIEPCILAGAPAGGIVLDPFFGSGTTGQVAQQLGRQFIGIELNPEYAPLQAERLRQPSLNLEAA